MLPLRIYAVPLTSEHHNQPEIASNPVTGTTQPSQANTEQHHISIMPEGAESPPPERQTGRQLHDPPSDGQGVSTGSAQDKKKTLESEVENLSSNPKGPTDDAPKGKSSGKKGNCD